MVNDIYPSKIDDLNKLLNVKSLDELDNIISNLLGEKENITLDEIKMFASNSMQKKNISNSIIDIKEEDIVRMYSNVFLK